MNIHQMEYFHVLADIGNMTKAAEYLQIAQPALSAALSRMSEELGYPLFVKQGRNIVLSKYGKIFLQHCDKILEEYNTALYEMQEVDMQNKKTLRLGVTGTSFARGYQKQFHEAFPQISISQTLVPSSKIVSTLKNDKDLDFVLCSTEVDDPELASMIIEYEPLYLVVSTQHPFATKPSIDLAETRYEKFISFPSDFVSHKVFVDLCRKAGFIPDIVMECYESQIPNLVEDNFGIAMINKAAILSGIYNRGCRVLPIDKPKCQRPIMLLWLKEKKMNAVAKLFHDFIKEHCCKSGRK